MKKRRVIVIGAGGFAREVKWLIGDIDRERTGLEFVGYAVSDLSKLGEHDSRDEVRGDLTWLRANRGEWDALAIGIGTATTRARLARELLPEFPEDCWPALVHPSVRYDPGSCEVGAGVILCAGVIGTVNLKLRPFCMVNLACTLGHEAELGVGCVLNPTVNISGGVVLEEGVLVGTGAQVLQYVRIGKNATVGAGAVVTKDVAPGETVVGMPARPLQRKGP